MATSTERDGAADAEVERYVLPSRGSLREGEASAVASPSLHFVQSSARCAGVGPGPRRDGGRGALHGRTYAPRRDVPCARRAAVPTRWRRSRTPCCRRDRAAGHLAHDVLGHVGGDAGAPLRPRDPERAIGEDGAAEAVDLLLEGTAIADEEDDDLGGDAGRRRTWPRAASGEISSRAFPGSSTTQTTSPSRIPSFCGSGVPE